ncbi:unnamed protein product [Agarophyton chilense]
MHGRNASQLLIELRKSKWLPPYSDGGLRQVAAEIKELLEPFLEIMQNHGASLRDNDYYQMGAVVFFRSIQRNKRCALAYLMNRLRRIKQYRWEMGACAAAHLSDNMSAPEAQFLKEYNNLIGRYSQTVNLDLTADAQPPRDLFIEVRVKHDCGSVLTDSGPVALKPGTAHFLKRSDVEHLIRQGALEHIV